MDKDKSKQCPYFDNCNVPICPLVDDDDLFWFPDDGKICKLEEFENLEWIKLQRKIKTKKLYKKNQYFTKKELKKICKAEDAEEITEVNIEKKKKKVEKVIEKDDSIKFDKKVSNYLKKFIP